MQRVTVRSRGQASGTFRTRVDSDDDGVARSAGEPPDTTAGREDPLLSFFIPTLHVGGAERVIVDIVNGLATRGYDVELLLSRFEGELRSRLGDEVTVVELPPSSTHVFGVAAHVPALIDYLRREKPAALFPHLTATNVVSLAAARAYDGLTRTDTMVVPTHHLTFGALPNPTPRDRIARWLSRRLYPSADRIIAVSDGVADSIADHTAVEREDISVLYNPIDVASIRDRARQPVSHRWFEDDEVEVVLFLGRLEEQKDLPTWLRAFERVHERNPDARAVIAGKGPMREDVLALADDLGLRDVVSMPGYVENPYGYFRQADVFLLSSRLEGLPTVLIEALACGCPVVATDCPSGPREILDGGTYGRLVSMGDVDGLADAVLETLADPMSSDELEARADDFASESVIDDYERFIREHVVSAGS